MELEKIKQALRMRSGRNIKSKKPARPKEPKAPDTAVPNGGPPKPADPSKQPPPEPEKDGDTRKEDHDKSFDLGPDAPNGTTVQDAEDNTPKAPRQYGRSGIVVPPGANTMANPEPHVESSDEQNFDLKAPAANPRPPSVENLAELLFSSGHLNSLLHDPKEVARFTAFLNRYRPEYQPLILQYLETQKAIKAIDYANAVAEGAQVVENDQDKALADSVPPVAATIDKTFEKASNSAFTGLVGSGLPAFITYNLVKLVTECLTNEITGKQSRLMQNMVGGLSEVFCVTDPNQDDNPIIYASEEFYRLTGYGRDDVIGHNCRFLQGRLTNPGSPKRLKEAVQKGEELSETLLNYRRDGRPFINLLMIAPLHDDKGELKYFIGAQADVTGLIEDGRGLDSFERYLAYRELENEAKSHTDADSKQKKKALKKLRELSEMFDLEESAVVQTASRASSMTRASDAGSAGSSERRRRDRRLFVADDESDDADDEEPDSKANWTLGQSGPLGLSGKLPGIYDSYMLIRAAPSLRIIFVSPKLRKLGKVVQNPFMSHVVAPATTLNGLKESFSTGTPVSARINFLPERAQSREGTKTGPGYKHEDGKNGRACWISATPMLGSDDRVGIWMIVIVEKAKAKRTEKVAEVEAKTASKAQRNKPTRIDLPERGRKLPAEEIPIKPKRLDDVKEDSKIKESSRKTSPVPQKPSHESENTEQVDQLPVNRRALAQTKNVEAEGEDQFVITKPQPEQTEAANRVYVQSDGDDDQEQNDWQPARSRSNTAQHHPEHRKYTPPAEIDERLVGQTPPPKTPGEGQKKLEDMDGVAKDDEEQEEDGDLKHNGDSGSGQDNTPTRARSVPTLKSAEEGDDERTDGIQDGSESDIDGGNITAIHTRVNGQAEGKADGHHDVNANKHENEHDDEDEEDEEEEEEELDEDEEADPFTSNQPRHFDGNLLTMDYLRHPGSRHVSVKKKKSSSDTEKWSDPDCMMSPYSVD